MNYNPRIYIRDYGAPTRRLLALGQGYEFDFSDIDLRRSLIMHAENPVVGEEFLLLDGDMQSGTDLLDMSGSGNDLLVLSNPVLMRFFGSDVALQYSNISGFPSWSYELVVNDADLRRSLFIRVDEDALVVTPNDVGLIRSLLMAADTASYAFTGNAANFTTGKIITADAATYAMTAPDAALLRQLPMAAAVASFAWSGTDATLTRSLVLSADAATYTATFNAALLSLDNIEALSGDASSGSDLSLLSGDAQSGTDFLLFSQ
jgi:hypothetical protein